MTLPAAIGIKAKYPGLIEPALATSTGKVPSGERWLHEIKFDGYRVQLHIVNEGVQVVTRRDNDWTSRFEKIAQYEAVSVRDDLVILSWQEHNGSTIMHALDFDSCITYAAITPATGKFERLTGRIEIKSET